MYTTKQTIINEITDKILEAKQNGYESDVVISIENGWISVKVYPHKRGSPIIKDKWHKGYTGTFSETDILTIKKEAIEGAKKLELTQLNIELPFTFEVLHGTRAEGVKFTEDFGRYHEGEWVDSVVINIKLRCLHITVEGINNEGMKYKREDRQFFKVVPLNQRGAIGRKHKLQAK